MEQYKITSCSDKLLFIRDLAKIYENNINKLIKILSISESELDKIIKYGFPKITICAYNNLILYTQGREFDGDDFLKNSLETVYRDFYKILNLINVYEDDTYIVNQLTYINKKTNKIINNYNNCYYNDVYNDLKQRMVNIAENKIIYTLSVRSYCRFTYNSDEKDRYIINSETFYNFIKEIDQTVRDQIYTLDLSGKSITNKILAELLEDSSFRENLPNCHIVDLSNNYLMPRSKLKDLFYNFVKTSPKNYKPEIIIYHNIPDLDYYIQGLDDKLRRCIKYK